ncbi:MAG: hypothetical protein P794_03695 [Epsilonproteobacteria bacterium (ex Lamellibrachia satsuma)]|nr:MAG: hypothetical protein P794_03695 [Epsilonproteobacteria bacterium (ex Lamellibrachia satsuma)]
MYNKNLRLQKEVVLCEDGTNTLYSKEFDEPYHSTKDGALHESLEKHVKPALALTQHKTKLTVLDICFGLGYNTFATLYYVKKHNIKTRIHILSPEFDEALIRSLNNFAYPPEFDSIKRIIKAISKDLYYEDEQFKIEILLGDARKNIPKIEKKIDIVYQDAFSPKTNPLLWTREYFKDIRGCGTEDMVLTTYANAAPTRMALDENGFKLFKYYPPNARPSIIASPKMLEEFEYIDMELKKERNPKAKSLRDEECLKRTITYSL